MKIPNHRRRNNGATAALAFVAIVPLVAALGGFAVDAMHFNDAAGALQRACDAAALAGAQNLGSYSSGKAVSGTSVSTGNNDSVNYALEVAQLNAVDGSIGLWSNGDRSITATIRYDSSLSGPNTNPNRCDVTASIGIKSLFTKIFGNYSQTVSTSASAGLTPLNKLYSYLPMIVSYVNPDENGKKLNGLSLGDTFVINIKNKSAGNTVWLYNNTGDNIDAIEHIVDPVTYPGNSEAALAIGDTIQSNNGQKSVGKIFDQLYGKDVALAVTEDNVDKDYLSKGQPSHKISYFVGFHITGYDNNSKGDGYSLTGTIISTPNAGGYDPSGTTNNVTGSVYLAKLIQ